jgi:hypothetical protein
MTWTIRSAVRDARGVIASTTASSDADHDESPTRSLGSIVDSR